MTKEEEIMKKLNESIIIDILTELNVPFKDKGHYIQCQSVCHGGTNWNLSYLKSKKFFNCFSKDCGGMTPRQFIVKITDKNKDQALQYLANKTGVSLIVRKPRAFNATTTKITDWNFLNLYNQEIETFKEKTLEEFPSSLLRTCEKNVYCGDWLEEHITIETMKKFNVHFHVTNNEIIIPHYDYYGRLIGIRARHFNELDLYYGGKYTPAILNGVECNHKLMFNLYGLHLNKNNIKKHKKIIIVESEKAVMQLEEYLKDTTGNIGVAICGSSIADYQRDLILELGVNEVIIAFDKDYEEIYEDSEYKAFCRKLLKQTSKFSTIINTSVIICKDNRLGYKDSPTDKGEDVFLQLLAERKPFVYEEEIN